MNFLIILLLVTFVLTIFLYCSNERPYLSYTLNGGIEGLSLKLDIYNNGKYEVYKQKILLKTGHLNKKTMNIIQNIVYTISQIKEEREELIKGSDILYSTLSIKN